MGGLCTTVGNFAWIFLLLAAIAALFETALLVIAKWGALKKAPAAPADVAAAADMDGLAKVLAAIKDMLLALKELPAWFALFLAGLALVWTASAAPHLCT
jgi:hypothetical protein